MLAFLGAGENLAFIVALAIMLLIGVIEATGLGASAIGGDVDIAGDGDWLGWLGLGRLPLLMLLVLYLAAFGTIGLLGQQIAKDSIGTLLPPLVAIPLVGLLALPATAVAARVIARIMPKDETTAIDIGQLVGLHGEIVIGRAKRGSPAKARIRDFHGQAHYVMVEPDDPDAGFAEGDEILLVRREGSIFRAIASDRPPFSNWIER